MPGEPSTVPSFIWNESLGSLISVPTGGSTSVPAEQYYQLPSATASKISKKAKLVQTPFMERRINEVFRQNAIHLKTNEFHEEMVTLHKLDNATSFEFASPNSLVGIEVEVENIKRIDPNLILTWWVIEEDASLRNNGREFKTCPLPLKYVEPALTQLFNGLNDDRDFSNRTSVHVHQDVRSFSMENLFVLILTYMIIEPLMFRFADSSRRKSIYCVPMNSANTLLKMCKHTDLEQSLYNSVSSCEKYSALNLGPINTFGTLEYRHMSGTDNIPKLLVWISLINKLKIWAYRTSLEDMFRHVSTLNTSSAYREFINQIFGDKLTPLLDISNLPRDLEQGVYNAKNIAFVNKWHFELLNKTPAKDSTLMRVQKIPGISEATIIAYHGLAGISGMNITLDTSTDEVIRHQIAIIREREEEYRRYFKERFEKSSAKKLNLTLMYMDTICAV